ncbi:MAG: polysaccharide biosynthesis C-terminal domain-containing protein [Lachnospiraceae bacterium]|nr:polysaccharide biosynthesis C-terminal domain-containing protein [Lachnospiraceae bacterium]
MEERANAFLGEEKLSTLMKMYSVPCIISLLVAALYNIVDQIFIANASYLGSYGNAANNVVFPLTIVALSLAVMIGDGCCAYVSICLGKNEKEDAHKSIGCAVVLVIIVGLLVAVVYAVLQEAILTFFGGKVNAETYACAKEYFTFITMGIPIYMFGQCLNPIIRSDGSPRFAMASTVLGAVFNIIFDPICIYGLHWGMKGAAIATVGGQILTAVLAIWYLFHMKAVRLERKSFGIFPGLMKAFLPLGITSFLSQISVVASMAAVNNMIVKYGALDPIYSLAEYSQIPMAVLGIVMKFFQIVISVSVGLAAGCIPVIGYNVGAEKLDRALNLFKMLLISEFIVGAVALVIVELLPLQLISIFGAANESAYYSEFAVKAFRIYLCMLPLATLNKGTFICLQSLGKAAQSSILSLIREVVFGVGWALILPVFFGLNGLLYSMPVSDLLTFFIAIVMILRIFRMLNTDGRAAA